MWEKPAAQRTRTSHLKPGLDYPTGLGTPGVTGGRSVPGRLGFLLETPLKWTAMLSQHDLCCHGACLCCRSGDAEESASGPSLPPCGEPLNQPDKFIAGV